MTLEHEPVGPRNLRIRELAAPLVDTSVAWLHEQFPWLTPNEVTVLGTLGTAVGAYLAQKDHETSPERFSWRGFIVLVGSACGDFLDGALARLIKKEASEVVYSEPGVTVTIAPITSDPEQPEKEVNAGAVIDAVGDRLGELVMALSRANSAHDRGDLVGEILAYLVAITNAFPSFLRAQVETQGRIVPEGGRDALGFVGTRVGRFLTSTVATVLPKVGPIPVQPILDATTSLANLKTTRDRLHILTQTPASEVLPLSPAEKATARIRGKALLAVVALAFAGAALGFRHHHKSSGPQQTY
jgi:phosphatidylglycerophosphate synthase